MIKMNKIKSSIIIIFTVISALFSNSKLHSCSLSNMTVTHTDCMNGTFNVTVNCSHEATSDSFRIQGNGIIYGHYAYSQLPVTLTGLEGNCTTNYEFVIRDLEYQDCQVSTQVGQICCDQGCLLSELSLTQSVCYDIHFHDLTLNFNFQNSNSDYYDLWLNTNYVGYFPLNQLPKTLHLENTTNQYDHIKLCINDNPDCCIDGNVLNPCYTAQNCNLSEISATTSECESGLFNVTINFLHQFTSDSFRIQGNGVQYGHFAYNALPITLTGLAGNCTTNYEFAIFDLENADCHISTSIGTKCCEGDCHIYNLTLNPSDCHENNTHQLAINFNYQNPGNLYYNLWVNNVNKGTFLLNELPKTITIENTSNQYDHVLVCINDHPNCCTDGNVANPCFISQTCHLYELSAIPSECENGSFDVLINFEHQFTSDSFRIQGNGVQYGHFAYDDLPVTLNGLVGNCTTNYEFAITDLENGDCHVSTHIGSICCTEGCHITNFAYEHSECIDQNHYQLSLNFTAVNPTSDFFVLKVNGNVMGYYPIANLPVTVSIPNSNQATDYFSVCIYNNNDCCKEWHFSNPCFQTGDCNIGSLNYELHPCQEGKFDITINFEHQFTSDSFRIQGNGHTYGHYAYSQLPITITGLVGNCETNYEFAVFDIEKINCHNSVQVGKVCCNSSSTNESVHDELKALYLINSKELKIEISNSPVFNVNVSIYNLLSQEVFQKHYNTLTGNSNIDLSGLKGLYIIKIEYTGSNKTIKSKLLKIIN